MPANATNTKVVYPELSYKIVGVLFSVHNSLGRFCTEKQYGDAVQNALSAEGLAFEREKLLVVQSENYRGENRADFVVEGKIVVELKAKPALERKDYDQVQRYLQSGKYKLGILVNFSGKYLHPKRILRRG